ncbi:hypothetical protein J2128_002157 [Methanomicrobium sp. W14]|nr:hypothetical protein [Methanomicrobium sp. W14]MBP2134191.1 hypothetical protein [Methanomicrobium sp. W14]
MDCQSDNEPLTKEELLVIEESLEEYKKGIYYTHEKILSDLGIH